MISLDITPHVGALPIEFGMSRSQVHAALGSPRVESQKVDRWGESMDINIGYDSEGRVNQFGFGPGDYTLSIGGTPVWGPDRHPDPNPLFLSLDPEPVEHVGFLYFRDLGVATTGYHDDDPSQRAISVYPRGSRDRIFLKAKAPDLARYR